MWEGLRRELKEGFRLAAMVTIGRPTQIALTATWLILNNSQKEEVRRHCVDFSAENPDIWQANESRRRANFYRSELFKARMQLASLRVQNIVLKLFS